MISNNSPPPTNNTVNSGYIPWHTRKGMRRPTMASYWHYNSTSDEELDKSEKSDPRVALSKAESELVESHLESVLELEVEVNVEMQHALTVHCLSLKGENQHHTFALSTRDRTMSNREG